MGGFLFKGVGWFVPLGCVGSALGGAAVDPTLALEEGFPCCRNTCKIKRVLLDLVASPPTQIL